MPGSSTIVPPPPSGKLKLPWWREAFAIAGIAAGFMFFFTIPGWFGIGAWRRYKRGEPSSITAWSIWGMFIIVAFVVIGVIAALTDGGTT
jgi:hypothetical protein